jgi:hypothetical protein
MAAKVKQRLNKYGRKGVGDKLPEIVGGESLS